MYAIVGRNSPSNSSLRKISANQPRESSAFASLRITTPLISPSLKLWDICNYLSRFEIHVVGSCFGDEDRGAQQTLEGSCISPPSLELLPGHRIAGYVSVVNVSNFKFSTT